MNTEQLTKWLRERAERRLDAAVKRLQDSAHQIARELELPTGGIQPGDLIGRLAFGPRGDQAVAPWREQVLALMSESDLEILLAAQAEHDAKKEQGNGNAGKAKSKKAPRGRTQQGAGGLGEGGGEA